MATVFENTPQKIGGAFTAEKLWLNLGDAGSPQGAVIQRVNFTIQRPIQFVYEIGAEGQPQNVYYVGGRRQGTATFERIVGGSDTFKLFLTQFGPLCATDSKNIELAAAGGCKIGEKGAGGEGVKYVLVTPKLTAVGASVSAQDIVIMETLSLMFLDLDVRNVDGTDRA